MKKIILILLFLVLLLVVPSSPALARGLKDTDEIPEKTGDYELTDHPRLRLHVYVHESKKTGVSAPLSCSVTDPDSAAVPGPAGWKLPAKWTYSLNAAGVPSTVGAANLPTIAGAAFSAWANASANKVAFTRLADTKINKARQDGKNILAWGVTSGPGTIAVTYTWYDQTTKLATEEDTIFNNRLVWSWTPYSLAVCPDPKRFDAQDILTHETGHWMGLDDSYASNFANNTMFGYGSKGEIKKDTLASGDVAAIKTIYP